MPHPARAQFGAIVSLTARAWRRAVDRRLQPFGLTQATWLPLVRLARADRPMRQKDLAASLGLDSSSVVRLLDALQAAGLVERKEEDGDRRAKVLVLTAKGHTTVERIEQAAGQVRDDVLQGIPESEIEQTYHLLRRVCDALENEEASQ